MLAAFLSGSQSDWSRTTQGLNHRKGSLKSSDPIINPELLLLPTAATQRSLNLCLNTSSDGELIIS